MLRPLNVDQIRELLQHVPANVDREQWVRVLMALKSELAGDDGLALALEWSATAANYSEASTRDTWRSIKPGGRVTIGTLIHAAKENGFVLSSDKPSRAPKPDVRAERKRRAQQHEAQETERLQGHEAAAVRAQRRWDAGAETGSSGYLDRKQVGAHGVRFGAGGDVLVPLRDGDGRLWNVQRIATARTRYKDGLGTDKLFEKGGRKSGLWHMLGVPAGAEVLLVAEGYATAASAHASTGRPAAVAFDAGNLVHVARALQALFPQALLLVCGDDDAGTHARTGRNPGREKAAAAAAAVQGAVVFPALPPTDEDSGAPENVDFNDLQLAQGEDAVRQTIETAIAAHRREQARATLGASDQTATGEVDAYGFVLDDSGVWHHGADKSGARKPAKWVCSRLDVAALTRNDENQDWGYLLRFHDPLGHAKQWAMPSRLLAGDGAEYRSMLLGMGLRIASAAEARTLLATYLQTRRNDSYALCRHTIGWAGQSFVLPHRTIGAGDQEVIFQTDTPMENSFRCKGSLEQWKAKVAAPCVRNSRLVFAVSVAFSGPLMRPAQMETGGFHVQGASSSGKTTALRVAASVYGGPSFLQRWRATDNALESIAAQHCDALLVLDELAQVDAKAAGEIAYMLANEQAKARSSRNGAARPRASWRLIFLSSGEIGLAAHVAAGGGRVRAGQEVRMVDIPAEAGAGMGMFEDLHDHEGGAAFARYMTQAAAAHHGVAGQAFLEHLCENVDGLGRRVRDELARVRMAIVPEGAAGQVERVGARFALVGVAGELATEAGITGWTRGEAERAAKRCFDDWLAQRGGCGNAEVKQMLHQVRSFLAMHSEGRFAWTHRALDDHSPKTSQRAGMRRLVDADGKAIRGAGQSAAAYDAAREAEQRDDVAIEHLVFADVFRQEVCAGFDHLAVCAVLLEHGCLVPDKGRKYDSKQRLPGIGLTWCYRVPARIFEVEV